MTKASFLKAAEVGAHLPKSHVVVADREVLRLHHHPWLQGAVGADGGEENKRWAHLEEALEGLARHGADRGSTLVAVGGGVVGDLAGMAAALYMRGIPVIQVPTTLLAMVDAAIGGKTAVDLAAGKNMAGAFHHPDAVYICLDWLETLPEREWRNGAAEMVKYGFIYDPELAKDLAQSPVQKHPALDKLVERCVRIKEEVVEADPSERTGLRAILNFGHTIGHALEAATSYKEYAHGEAVAIGMVAEARLAEALGMAEPGLAADVQEACKVQGLPTELPSLPTQDLISIMRRDKKARDGKLAFSLVNMPGECKLVSDVPESDVAAVLG